MTQRRAAEIRGVVQGVGFRPFVARIAEELAVTGTVANTSGSVALEIEGPARALDRFSQRMLLELPEAARIDELRWWRVPPVGDARFTIAESQRGDVALAIPPDLTVCAACLAEIDAPGARRRGYPFTNCTRCGPRFTITRAPPYDRARTSMAAFPMCDACAAEYRDPSDRRCHAQPIACPRCGPKLRLEARDGRIIAVGDAALRDAVTALRRGEIVALKGLGGYQLLVRADDEAAVTRLRARKRRPRKPLALLVASLEEARALARIDDDEARALRDPAGPIVLARRRGDAVAAAVAPGQRRLGLMLPTTPLHALLARGVDAPLVCTSGNVHEEPMCVADADARARLSAIADCFLGHDREILRRADDSVVQLVGGRARTLRAARGLRPRTLALPGVGGPTLALGGHLKQAPALWVDGRVALWPELGDLDTPRARDAMIATIADVEAFLGVRAERVAHDAHPDFATTIWAEQSGRSSIPVWHHHAHVAAVLAEHGRAAALGFAWDGYGRGADAGLWGGETLEVDRRRACRVGHLRSFPLVGGDAAARDGRRALVGLLVAADLELPDDPALRRLAAAASRPGAPRCTSVGRLFDGVAALTGVAARSTYEGEAAMMLEAIAEPGAAPYPFSIAEGALDWRPALSAMLCERDDAALVASRLHATLIAALVEVAARRRAEVVALAGGCFQNALLLGGALDALAERGVEALAPEAVPPGDGGLALGQAWVASGGLSCV